MKELYSCGKCQKILLKLLHLIFYQLFQTRNNKPIIKAKPAANPKNDYFYDI
jgi:hypothetical protein